MKNLLMETQKQAASLVVQFFYYALIVIIVAITVYGIYELRIPLGIAVLFYFLLDPLVDFIEGLGIHRGAASALGILAVILVITGLAMFMGPFIVSEAQSIINNTDQYEAKAITLLESIKSLIKSTAPGMLDADQIDAVQMWQQILGFMGNFLPTSGDLFHGLSVIQEYVTNIFFNGLISFIALFFLLLGGSDIYINLMSLVPNRYFEMTLLLVNTVNRKINSYLLALFAQMAIMSTITVVGFILVDAPYAPILGLFAGLINIIPYLGPIIGAIPALILVLLDSGFSMKLGLTLGVVLIAQLVDQVYNQPVLLAKAMDLNPLIALIALGTFQALFGVVGMIIAIPFTGIILVIIPVVKRNLKAFGII